MCHLLDKESKYCHCFEGTLFYPGEGDDSSSEVSVVILLLDTVLYAKEDAVNIDHGTNISYTEYHSFELHVLIK